MVLLHEEGIASGVPEMKNEGIVGRKVDRKGILTNWLNGQPKRAFLTRPFRERAGVRVINRTVAGLIPLTLTFSLRGEGTARILLKLCHL
ncbi:hypothetical protein A7589_04530 [Escherichia sp. MOD1-EC6475]|nr:hypothetical protein A7589_04530 [Escherichia sp. MOD1-EC6475]